MKTGHAKAFFSRLKTLLSVPADNPELTLAQFKAFSRQVPLLYFILSTNMVSLVATHYHSAPTWLVVFVPAVFILVFVGRSINWIMEADKRRQADAAYAYRRLVQTNRLTFPIAMLAVAWSVALLPYGNDFQRAHVAFFMAITVIGIIFCLMHLRSAALLVTVLVIVPFSIVMARTGEPTLVATAVNMLLVAGAMLVILQQHYRDFSELTEQRLTLLSQQAALEAKNREAQRLSDENLLLANLDSLTQIANRRSFFNDLRRVFENPGADNRRVAIGVLDLDGFKPVNDTFGHSAGDRVLVEVAGRLSALSAPAHRVYRLGGDEFAVLFAAEGLSEGDIADLGQCLCDSVAEPIAIGSGLVNVAASMGVAVYPDVGVTGQDLYERADYALYNAKREYRGGVVVFKARQAEALYRHREVEAMLLSGDFESELSLVYQPIVDSTSGATIGFEALARWTSLKIGPVSPAEFIPIAEQHGHIHILTRHLLTLALRDAKAWPGRPFLSFNLSPLDLAGPENMERIVSVLNSSGFDPKRVTFEITETAVMRDFEQATQSIELLRSLGSVIALDDFGTGFSSLNHVHKLPLSKIKIDRSFVDKIDQRPASYKIVKSVSALCNEMGLSAIAEGVETKAEAETLAALGIGAMQGYHFARPLTQAMALKRLEEEFGSDRAAKQVASRSA